jgi:hypothetical protein
MRKFKHNNQNYEYVVGRRFIKIVNRDTNKSVCLRKEKVAPVYYDCELGCNLDPTNESTACPHAKPYTFASPSQIKQIIQREGI